MLRLRGYISVWLALQVSHSDVVGVGLGGVAKRVVPSHSPLLALIPKRLFTLGLTPKGLAPT